MDEAETYFREAVQWTRERGVTPGLHEAYHWLAAIHLARGDGDAALAAARQALAEVEDGGAEHAMLGAVYSSGLLEDAEDPVLMMLAVGLNRCAGPCRRARGGASALICLLLRGAI